MQLLQSTTYSVQESVYDLNFLLAAKFFTDSEPVSDVNLNSPVNCSTDRSETLTDSTSSEDKRQGSSSSKSDIISSKACIVITKKFLSNRPSRALLDCGAE